jgi:dipeptidase E
VNLVLYSGGFEKDNLALDSQTIKLTGKESPSITYIPSCSYDSEVDFNEFIKHYRELGISRFIHFPVDVDYDETIKREAFSSDIIHLSGGNTFYFLKHLRKKGMLKELKSFVKRGGVLTGLSAGAILMTPTIDTAAFPHFDKDENEENVKNLKAMNLVGFEFFPHYKNSKRYDSELLEHSKKLERPIYACPDGSGIVVKKESLKFQGKCFCFFRGKKIKIK